MPGNLTEISSTAPGGPIVKAPVQITGVVAFVDGSPFAERALQPGRPTVARQRPPTPASD